jgi:hypothetical protein
MHHRLSGAVTVDHLSLHFWYYYTLFARNLI